MFNTDIEYNIYQYIQNTDRPEIDPANLQQFADDIKAAMIRQFNGDKDEKFRIRMSSIGKPLRQLCLERDHGFRNGDNPTFKILVAYGDMIEALFMFIMREAGVDIVSFDEKVELEIGGTTLVGTYDVVIRAKIEDRVYDIKSCSPWAYENKFSSYSSVARNDSFGYVGQGFGYAEALKMKFGGWIVINKVNGNFKVVGVPDSIHDSEKDIHMQVIKDNVEHVVQGKPTPPCACAEEETFNGKPTGNIRLNKSGRFCNYKADVCHPGLRYLPEVCSKAKNPKMFYYTYVDPKWGV